MKYDENNLNKNYEDSEIEKIADTTKESESNFLKKIIQAPVKYAGKMLNHPIVYVIGGAVLTLLSGQKDVQAQDSISRKPASAFYKELKAEKDSISSEINFDLEKKKENPFYVPKKEIISPSKKLMLPQYSKSDVIVSATEIDSADEIGAMAGSETDSETIDDAFVEEDINKLKTFLTGRFGSSYLNLNGLGGFTLEADLQIKYGLLLAQLGFTNLALDGFKPSQIVDLGIIVGDDFYLGLLGRVGVNADKKADIDGGAMIGYYFIKKDEDFFNVSGSYFHESFISEEILKRDVYSHIAQLSLDGRALIANLSEDKDEKFLLNLGLDFLMLFPSNKDPSNKKYGGTLDFIFNITPELKYKDFSVRVPFIYAIGCDINDVTGKWSQDFSLGIYFGFKLDKLFGSKKRNLVFPYATKTTVPEPGKIFDEEGGGPGIKNK